MKSLSILLFLSFLCVAELSAQTASGSISGTVTDAQSASLVNAKVTITDQDKRSVIEATTDASGRFSFPQLAPGNYTLHVQAPGFRRIEQKNITLNANDKLALPTFVAEIGSIDQTIEVSAQALELQTESAERGSAIVGKQLQNVAVNGRGYLALVNLAPGVVSTVNLQTAGSGGLGSISANGARTSQNNLTLDGIGNVDTGSNGGQLATISLDSVQEFKILTSNYQAEYGRSSGAQISVVTKSGSSEFHGSAYLFHRHEGLNANNWKNNRDGLQRNKYRYNDPGYTIGGPVFIPKVFNRNKDKLFFFFSQEYQKQLVPQSTRNVTMPTALERKGDFSQTVDNNGNPFPYIKDPLSSLPCNSTSIGGCFADGGVLGKIPASRLYAPGLAILNFYPLPNAQLATNKGFNFQSQVSDTQPRREDALRVDYNISSKWKMFGRFVNNTDVITTNYASFVMNGNYASPNQHIDARPARSTAFSVTTLISPTMTNEATFGVGQNKINIDGAGDGLTRKKNGLSDLPQLYPSAVQGDYLPSFAFGGSRLANSPSRNLLDAPFVNYNTTIDFIDNLSKVWNGHTIKTGIYFSRSRKDQSSFAPFNGTYNFGDLASNPLDTGYGYANAAVGVYQTFQQASQYANGMYRYTNVEGYIQDNWKVNRRLTLDYGLRLYWIQPQFDAALQTSTFLPNRFDPAKASRLWKPALNAAGQQIAVDPLTGATNPVSSVGRIITGSGNILNGVAQAGKDVSKYLMENRGIHWAPRFGFAYDLTGKQNLVLRGGGGMFYDRFQGNEVFAMLQNPPTTFSPTLFNGFLKDIDSKNALLAPPSLDAFSYDGKVATVYNFNVGIQARVPFGMVLDTSYVGSISNHLLQRLNLNAIPYGATFLPQNQDPTKVAATPNAILGNNAYNQDFLRPYQGFGNINLHQMGGTSNYNSLQVSLNKRFSKGFLFGLAYTWSKALTTASGDGSFFRIDSNNRLANYGLADFHRAQTLAVNYVYELPGISHYISSKSWLHSAIDGWQISGITVAQTGQPFDVGMSISGVGNQNLTGSYTEGARINLIGNPLTGTSQDPYKRLNAAAYTTPPVGTIGLTAPVRYLIRPGFVNYDFTLQKTFLFTERTRLQLRADAFNVFNHTQFNGINSTLNFASLTNPNPTNLPFNADGTLRDKNGFGTVSGARDPRILQLVVRFQF
ncbi:carboxypeptidase regulatory-like domain-containing protein [Bryobacter aggregatus]|uniref:carboxypeptidase regulatory-like domain-containing protein n=1 Tax=Bryobacter aggregatus TaxID=360054 RepID=UPI0009B5B855|nr:carboxypeptidase regulatory-like domain-containing protein [Bryobacter aggregatus]